MGWERVLVGGGPTGEDFMKKLVSFFLAGLILVMNLVGCGKNASDDSNNPVTLTMWHVYGSQTESPMNDSINEFNRTVGEEKGIVVNVVSVSSSSAKMRRLLLRQEIHPVHLSFPIYLRHIREWRSL